ncbi:MAG TPA: PHP domain-containing protein [Bacteroidales bacterium]|jgi:hypothetical protein|nr:PHP domain-containing protein [Bacteroidales bacterium]
MITSDLHIHSEYSLDGDLNVCDILHDSQEAGLQIISITDHNLVKAIPEALSEGLNRSIRVIPGIEIDCNYKGTDLHVLGYNINWQSKDFGTLETDFATKIIGAFSQMIVNLHKMGIDINAAEVLDKAGGQPPSGELIAEVLLTNTKYDGLKQMDPYRTGGSRSDNPYLNFYLDFFAQDKPAHVEVNYMNYEQAVDLIKRNGGIPVIAHPGLNFRGREEVVEELLKLGAKGLEAFNNYHTEKQIEYFASVAVKRKVLMTGGSDFHGKTKPVIRLGSFKSIQAYEAYLRESVEELLC